jgi:hypothetical protein
VRCGGVRVVVLEPGCKRGGAFVVVGEGLPVGPLGRGSTERTPAPAVRDLAELLDVHVDQLAGAVAFVADRCGLTGSDHRPGEGVALTQVGFGLTLLVVVVLVVVVGLLTKKPPYECPPGKSIVATVKRHSDSGPMLIILTAAGIDTDVVEETAKPLRRRLPFLFYTVYRPHEPQGPWHVVVPTSALPEAQRLLPTGEHG